jgi:hypothetical protein
VKKTIGINIAILVFVLSLLGAGMGCDNMVRGGAEVWLENISVGDITMDGKPVQGLPSSNISAVLKASSNKIYIKATDDGFIMTLKPSNAVITSNANGLSISGMDPEDIELKFQTTEED